MCVRVWWRAKSISTTVMFFAATPPLESKRILFSEFASKRCLPDGRPLELSFVDIRKAYFNGIPKRRLHLFLPREMGQAKGAIAHLKRCVYGTRDAGLIWEECYSRALTDLGFRRGISSPCCFYHPGRAIAVVIHGDDFTALAAKDDLDWYEAQLSEVFELKIKGRLGEAERCDKEVRVLNRVIRLDKQGLLYEADPRHGEMLIQAAGLQV